MCFSSGTCPTITGYSTRPSKAWYTGILGPVVPEAPLRHGFFFVMPLQGPGALAEFWRRVDAIQDPRTAVHPTDPDDGAFVQAVRMNNGADVRRLLGRAPYGQRQQWALQWSAWQGRGAKEMAYRIAATDPKAYASRALRWAAEQGHAEAVRLLLPVSNPEAGSPDALMEAARNGHAPVVALLIPVSSAKCMRSRALWWAAWNRHAEVVDLLVPVGDVREVWGLMVREPRERKWGALETLAPWMPTSKIRSALAHAPAQARSSAHAVISARQLRATLTPEADEVLPEVRPRTRL